MDEKLEAAAKANALGTYEQTGCPSTEHLVARGFIAGANWREANPKITEGWWCPRCGQREPIQVAFSEFCVDCGAYIGESKNTRTPSTPDREMLLSLLDWADKYRIELHTVIVDEFLAQWNGGKND